MCTLFLVFFLCTHILVLFFTILPFLGINSRSRVSPGVQPTVYILPKQCTLFLVLKAFLPFVEDSQNDIILDVWNGIMVLYTRKFLPGENFCQFHHWLSSWQTFYPANFLSCVNDHVEDIWGPLPHWRKFWIFLQYKGSWAWRNFCQVKIFTYTVAKREPHRSLVFCHIWHPI